MRHYTNLKRADSNREYIYKFIQQYPGITQKGIQAKTSFTRQTLSHHLSVLIKHKKIYFKNHATDKRTKIYFPEDSGIGNLNIFSRSMQDAGITMIDPGLIEPHLLNLSQQDISNWKERPEPRFRLISKLINITVSDKYCKSEFSRRDLNEMLLFEFVNRVGAFIAYVFIETMRPSNHNNFKPSKDKRNEIRSVLLNNAINIHEMYERFRLLYQDSGLIKEEYDTKEKYLELNDNTFDKLSEVFRNVYPNIYEGLENYWKSSAKYALIFNKITAKTNDCTHKWEDTYLYNYGDAHRCYKCNLVCKTPIINDTTKKRRLS